MDSAEQARENPEVPKFRTRAGCVLLVPSKGTCLAFSRRCLHILNLPDHSLLLLSDFHPRSMHFPPNDDDEDILVPDEAGLKDLSSVENNILPPGSESTFAGWTEPAVRSDRMSWSLIGFAHALAYELGIFGTYSDGIVTVDGRVKRQGGPLTHHKRADRLERLLYIYMTQACGRFGFPSMYPDNITAHNLATMRDGFTSGQSSSNCIHEVES